MRKAWLGESRILLRHFKRKHGANLQSEAVCSVARISIHCATTANEKSVQNETSICLVHQFACNCSEKKSEKQNVYSKSKGKICKICKKCDFSHNFPYEKMKIMQKI